MAHPLTHLTHGIPTRRPFHPAKTASAISGVIEQIPGPSYDIPHLGVVHRLLPTTLTLIRLTSAVQKTVIDGAAKAMLVVAAVSVRRLAIAEQFRL
jgi:hypothetical protein